MIDLQQNLPEGKNAEVFPQKAALKLKPKLPSMPKLPDLKLPFKLDKTKMIAAAIFIISLVVMLAVTINAVDVYNGTFP